ncbi:MAG TPA: hypothetical protein VKV38_08855 [Trebonia sp.]|jgi:hypothetical protein|nr:hypothetical protein [Trebonia sp.]
MHIPMHILVHFLSLLVPPGIAAGPVVLFALVIRLSWRRGKSATMP